MSGIDKNELIKILETLRSALKKGASELINAEVKFGRETFTDNLAALNSYSEMAMRKALHEIPDGDYTSNEFIETDGFGNNQLRIQCRLIVQGENVLVSFGGTSKQTKGPYNCNYSMTHSACFWFFRSLVKRDIPINAGAFKTFSVEAPEGTLINAKYPAPLLGGYEETSKRIIDCLYSVVTKALPAESQAQNGAVGSILINSKNKFFSEILEGGGGATSKREGESAIFSGVQNFPHISIEDLEKNFPIQVVSSHLRKVSGGDGKRNGGSGLSRSYKFLEEAKLFILCDKRQIKSKGFFGGTSGHPADFFLISNDKKESLKDKKFVVAKAGDILIANTPGGGAWGKKPDPEPKVEDQVD